MCRVLWQSFFSAACVQIVWLTSVFSLCRQQCHQVLKLPAVTVAAVCRHRRPSHHKPGPSLQAVHPASSHLKAAGLHCQLQAAAALDRRAFGGHAFIELAALSGMVTITTTQSAGHCTAANRLQAFSRVTQLPPLHTSTKSNQKTITAPDALLQTPVNQMNPLQH